MEKLGIVRTALMVGLFGIELVGCTDLTTSSEDQSVTTSSATSPHVLLARAADGPNDGTQCPGTPMTDHHGPVMHNARIHPIYWQPNGNANWTALVGVTPNQLAWFVTSFVTDFSAFPMFQTMAEYPDSSGNHPSSVTLGAGQTQYAGALPHAGSTADPVQESDIVSIIDSFVSSNGLPTTTDDLYVLMMPTNVHFCDRAGQCTFPRQGVVGILGGWHNVTPGGRVYAVIGSDDTLSPGTFTPNLQSYPNGQAVDTMFNVLSHEIFEALTDPRSTGWFGPSSLTESCFENGDRCNGRSLSFSVIGSSTLDTMSFNIQQEWSNATANCGQENPHVTSVVPNSGPLTGTNVTIYGTNFAPNMTIPGVTNLICGATSCTGTMPASSTPGPIKLWARFTVTSDPNVGEIADVTPTTTFTYNPPAAPPSCAQALACPASYGPQIMTVSCASTVQFYLVDSYTHTSSPFPGTSTSMQYTMQTYPNNSIAACAPGTAPSLYGPLCATFSTYEPTVNWCGPINTGGGGNCKAPLHDCGDGTCARFCT